ncbi:hypothetical protein GCK32_009344 [Trichostrongylus colubriformis]|uniref:Uncharacterized protein n=1 Tax=Trichostrongylus colubriformis TaxID=6319 RepID=A0AAN8IEK1_TRICO
MRYQSDKREGLGALVKAVIESAINNLNGMSDDDQNERNVNLYRQAIDALQSVEELTFTREELLQLSGEIRSLISANTLYNSNRCDRRSSGENDDYDNLIDDLNNDGTDNSNDTNEDDDNISTRVRRVERILDAASDIIEDYCD